MQKLETIISTTEMPELVNRSSRTIWRWWQKDHTFPKPIRCNGRAIGWKKSDYDKWLNGDWKEE